MLKNILKILKKRNGGRSTLCQRCGKIIRIGDEVVSKLKKAKKK